MKRIVKRDPKKYIEALDNSFEWNAGAVKHYFPERKDLRKGRLLSFVRDFGFGLADSIDCYEDMIEIYKNGKYGFPSVIEEACATLIIKRCTRDIEINFSQFREECLKSTTEALVMYNRMWKCPHCERKGLMIEKEKSGNSRCSYDSTGSVAETHFRCVRCDYQEIDIDSAE